MAENKPMKRNEQDSHKVTPEITLRAIDLTDVDDFMIYATDDRVTSFCLWDTYTSREQAFDFFKNNAMIHPWFRAICIDDHVVGSITVTPRSGYEKCRAELGYVLAFEHWGKGVMTRAVKMVSSMIFKEWTHLERLEAFVGVDNIGSQRVLEKAGFVKEGVLRKNVILKGKCRDTAVFSLLSSDNRIA